MLFLRFQETKVRDCWKESKILYGIPAFSSSIGYRRAQIDWGTDSRIDWIPSTIRTQHLPSHFLRFTTSIIHLPFIQLFIHQTYGHTFSVPNEPTKTKIHQICRQVLMSKIIEQSHFQLLVSAKNE